MGQNDNLFLSVYMALYVLLMFIRLILGNRWGCDDTGCGMGLGNQEQFINCADIAILENCAAGPITPGNFFMYCPPVYDFIHIGRILL